MRVRVLKMKNKSGYCVVSVLIKELANALPSNLPGLDSNLYRNNIPNHWLSGTFKLTSKLHATSDIKSVRMPGVYCSSKRHSWERFAHMYNYYGGHNNYACH